MFTRVIFHLPIAHVLSKRTRPFWGKALLALVVRIIRSHLICQRSFQDEKVTGLLIDHKSHLLFFQNLVLLFKIQRQLKFLRKYFLINKNALKFFWYPAKVDIWITFCVLGKEFYKSSLYPWWVHENSYNNLSWNSIVSYFLSIHSSLAIWRTKKTPAYWKGVFWQRRKNGCSYMFE